LEVEKMYSWGPDTKDWKRPGYDFGSARRGYLDDLAADADAKGPRSYIRRDAPDSKLVGTKGKIIQSLSENPIVIATDVTGSMASWPAEIFDRLPLLYQTLSKYKEDLEICFAAIGDATCDDYPLQVNDFGKAVDLDEHLKALCAEGGGGGQHRETYELFAYYMLNKADTPNAISPFLIIFGDEAFYEHVNPRHVEHYIGDVLQDPVDSMAVWKAIGQRFNTYLLHKKYHSPSLDGEIVEQWKQAIGEQKVIPIEYAERAVDVAMGIIAKYWGQFSDFDVNLSARHDADGRATVYDSLRYVDIADPTATKSVIDRALPGAKSIPLLRSGRDVDYGKR